MQASINTNRDGSVAMQLDVEAARAVLASVLFASRFHEGLAPLARVAEEGLRSAECPAAWRKDSCQ
jgi:hypothetical protein